MEICEAVRLLKDIIIADNTFSSDKLIADGHMGRMFALSYLQAEEIIEKAVSIKVDEVDTVSLWIFTYKDFQTDIYGRYCHAVYYARELLTILMKFCK